MPASSLYSTDMLSIKQAAARLGISPKTVRRWIEAGQLHIHRLGRRITIAEEDLTLFLAARRR
jgi:excisionase family DNA binding protein